VKTFFIIPGFAQKANHKGFRYIKNFLTQKGFRVVVADMTWQRRTLSDYAKEFEEIYTKEKSATNYVLGFSYGAVTAFLTANELKPKKIFLCSLSSAFKEDMRSIKPWVAKYLGKGRVEDSKLLSGRALAKGLNVPSVIFYGEKEGKQYPQLKKRCTETAKLAKNSKLVVAPSAPHQIDHSEYKKALLAELAKL
jgi:pimeloyl-ACP methyl ester carboxylesterase